MTDDIGASVRQAMAEDKLRVTTRDTDALSGKMNDINIKVNVALAMLTLVVSLLVATYGINAFLFWRMVQRLADG